MNSLKTKTNKALAARSASKSVVSSVASAHYFKVLKITPTHVRVLNFSDTSIAIGMVRPSHCTFPVVVKIGDTISMKLQRGCNDDRLLFAYEADHSAIVDDAILFATATFNPGAIKEKVIKALFYKERHGEYRFVMLRENPNGGGYVTSSQDQKFVSSNLERIEEGFEKEGKLVEGPMN